MSKIIRLQKVDSTNDYAQMHFDSLPDRVFITAQGQTKGKGRRGKPWLSPVNSSLSASYVIKDIIPCEHYKSSWLGGLAALYTIRDITKTTEKYWIKWPNDIYCSKKKIAGILCETKLRIDNRIDGVIVGIGINVNTTLAELKNIDKPATSILAETGTYTKIESAADILLSHLNRLYDMLLSKNTNSILELWKKENALIGNCVEILLDNDNILHAKVLDIESSGKLVVVDNDANIHKIYSGDVSIKSFL